jgi:outer membrane receptor protein involved in Fe transport
MRQRLEFSIKTGFCAVVACGLIESAIAQTEAPEIVVTTGFRPEPLADSIGSTSVIDSTLIGARAAAHLESVVGAAPNITMTSGGSRGRFVQVRGIGDLEQFVDPKHFPSVGVMIDGIDIGGVASAAMLFDVEQVEVLRGPQGTRFGAGALAGQVNIVSAAPASDGAAYVDAGLADYGTAMVGFAGGGSLTETLSARVAVAHHRGDGYQKNAWLGRDDTNGYDESMLRARLRWDASDTARIDFTLVGFDNDNGYDAFSLDNSRTTLSDEPGRDDLALTALGIRGSWDLHSGGSIEASVSWLDSEVDYGFDEDWTYVGFCDGSLCDPVVDFFSNTDRYIRNRENTSIDLRWLGQSRSGRRHPRQYVLGAYIQDRQETLMRQYYGPFSSDYSVDRVAIYGQAAIALSARLELTLGFRHEQFDDSYSDSFAFSTSSSDDLSSGEIAFRYSLSDATTLYALVSQGTKPGGVNTEANSVLPLVQPRFQAFLQPRLTIGSERLTNVEFGFRQSVAAGRLQMRASVFRMSRDDAQLESWFWDPVNFLWVGLLDSADGTNLGAEFDFKYQVSNQWRLSGSIGLLDTKVDALTTFDLDSDEFVVREGLDQTKAPAWQVHLGSEWTIDDWLLSVGIDANDSHRYGYYHDALIGRSTIVDASIRRVLGTTEVTLWTRNLLDEDVAVHGLYFGNDPRKGWVPEQYLQFGEPRLIGISVRRSF